MPSAVLKSVITKACGPQLRGCGINTHSFSVSHSKARAEHRILGIIGNVLLFSRATI